MERNDDPKIQLLLLKKIIAKKKERRPMSTSGGLLESAIDKFAREGGFDDSPLKESRLRSKTGMF